LHPKNHALKKVNQRLKGKTAGERRKKRKRKVKKKKKERIFTIKNETEFLAEFKITTTINNAPAGVKAKNKN